MKHLNLAMAVGAAGLMTLPAAADVLFDNSTELAWGVPDLLRRPANLVPDEPLAAGGGVLYDNGAPDGVNGYSNATVNVFGSRRTILDDFTVPDGETWAVQDFHWHHLWNSGASEIGTGVELTLWSDAGGAPGDPIEDLLLTSYSEMATGSTFFSRPEMESWSFIEEVVLEPGTYWIEWVIVSDTLDNNFALTAPRNGTAECWVNYDDLGGLQPGSAVFGVEADMAWSLTGELVSGLEAFLDIKPGSCPNSFNRRSRGVLPVALVGTGGFDVTMVDVDSLLISRADGVGGSIAPLNGPPGPGIVVEDVATPFEGELCDCHEFEGDGIDDLSMKFRTRDLVEALELGDLLPGDFVELVLSGTLLDGTEFSAADCLRLVPASFGTSEGGTTD